MHQSYEKIVDRLSDFRVHYQFYSSEEGGRLSLPYQGIKLDFFYESDLHPKKQHFIIWPEFEDENQQLITIGDVLEEGTARMWIINPDWIDYHREKIQIGTIGYFMEGTKPVASCKVIELIGLK